MNEHSIHYTCVSRSETRNDFPSRNPAKLAVLAVTICPRTSKEFLPSEPPRSGKIKRGKTVPAKDRKKNRVVGERVRDQHIPARISRIP